MSVESRRPSQPWKPGDDLEAVRLETTRDLAEAAQLTAMSKNVHMWRGAQGGTAISVDDTPRLAPAATLPTGQYQFMVYTMVSQNAAGWDFVRAHGILEV